MKCRIFNIFKKNPPHKEVKVESALTSDVTADIPKEISKKIPEELPLERISFGDWVFGYTNRTILSHTENMFQFYGRDISPSFLKKTLIFEVSKAIKIYQSADGQAVLYLYESVPTFDAGDREYDSYKELYIFVDRPELEALMVRGGYRLGSVFHYAGLQGMDPKTKELLDSRKNPDNIV